MTNPNDSLRDLQRHDYVFPFEVASEDGKASCFCSGMKMRDYFAAKAMQGLLANPDFSELTTEETAKLAYEMADAMVRRRGPR